MAFGVGGGYLFQRTCSEQFIFLMEGSFVSSQLLVADWPAASRLPYNLPTRSHQPPHLPSPSSSNLIFFLF